MLTIVGFVVLCILAYVGVATMGYLSGGQANSAFEGAARVFRPGIFAVMVFANATFGAAVALGFQFTKFAVVIAVSIGIVVTYWFSVAVVGATVSPRTLAGMGFVIFGALMMS